MAFRFADADSVRRGPGVVLYGGGNTGRDVCRLLLDAGVQVVCVLDRRGSEKEELLGVPVRTLECCPIEPHLRRDLPVVLSIFNSEVDVPSLAEQLRLAGFTDVVSFVNFHAMFADALGDRFWLTHRGCLEEARAELREVQSLWADDRSREIYNALLALRSRGEYGTAIRPDPQSSQYFPRDVPKWLEREPLRVIDCGAFTGDSMELIVRSGRRVEASAHFEPDRQNFSRLAEYLREHSKERRGPAMLWPCVLSDRPGSVHFREGLLQASRVGTDGTSIVTAVRLDDVLIGWQPTFLKMDIEGAEFDALVGGRGLIAESRPSLAVSVYHKPDHLWSIPLLLSSWSCLRGYKFFLRPHGYDGFDTVLYGVPPS